MVVASVGGVLYIVRLTRQFGKVPIMDPRRKRILYRSQHQGMKENDILLGGFTAVHVGDLEDSQLDQLEALLNEDDNDLYNWITGKTPVPLTHDHDLMAWLKKFNNCP